jgi:hypothetical protein
MSATTPKKIRMVRMICVRRSRGASSFAIFVGF